MGNCLKTQLKETVNNSNLEKLGELVLRVRSVSTSSAENQMFIIRGNEPFTLKTEGKYMARNYSNLDTENAVDTLEFTGRAAEEVVYLKNADYNLHISNKYCLTRLFNMLSISSSVVSCITADLKKLKGIPNLEYVRFRMSNCAEGDIDAFAGITSLQELWVGGNANVTGNLLSLSSCSSLTRLEATSTAIAGELVDFAPEMAKSRNSGTLQINCNGIITLNGTAVANNTSKFIEFGTELPSGAETTGTGWAIYATNPNA